MKTITTVRLSDLKKNGHTLSAKKALTAVGHVRVRKMSPARYRELANGWFRRMAGWTLHEVARQLAHPGPLVGACDSRLKF